MARARRASRFVLPPLLVAVVALGLWQLFATVTHVRPQNPADALAGHQPGLGLSLGDLGQYRPDARGDVNRFRGFAGVRLHLGGSDGDCGGQVGAPSTRSSLFLRPCP